MTCMKDLLLARKREICLVWFDSEVLAIYLVLWSGTPLDSLTMPCIFVPVLDLLLVICQKQTCECCLAKTGELVGKNGGLICQKAGTKERSAAFSFLTQQSSTHRQTLLVVT